jgi:hypothetical protein
MVQRTLIRPPSGRIGPITADERRGLIDKSPVFGRYEELVDRESAYETLQKKAEQMAASAAEAARQQEEQKNSWGNVIFGRGPRGGASMGEQVARDVTRSLTRSVVTQVKNAIIKSIFKR